MIDQKPRLIRIVTWFIGSDRLVHVLLTLGLLLNLALFAYIGWRYRALPGSLPLHFDILGQPDRLGMRSEIFKLPAIGLLLWVLNSLFGLAIQRWEKMGTYLLLGVATVVQLLFWLAALNIMG
jgi:uncharacterized membrane protein